MNLINKSCLGCLLSSKRKLLILIIASILWVFIFSASLAQANQNTLWFSNFSERVSLKRDGKQREVYHIPNGIDLKVSSQMLIKVEEKNDVDEILKKYSSVTNLVLVYEGFGFSYYRIKISNTSQMQILIDKLEKEKGVLLVQPDLLQLNSQKRVNRKTNEHFKVNDFREYLSQIGMVEKWRRTKGKGVKLAIIDDGFFMDHEDLQQTKIIFSYDIEMQKLNARPKRKIDKHGTQVAGIIFSQHNSIGIDGIAPDSGLIAIRHSNTWTSDSLLAFNLARMSGADIINCSWLSPFLLEPLSDIVNDLAENGRNGKGVVIVFAAGNGGKSLQGGETEASMPNVISVGALDENGNPLAFSNYGPMVQYYAYGAGFLTTSANGNFYSVFRGTSLAAPILSGYTALLLAENNTLTLSQVKKKLKKVFSLNQSEISK